MPRISGVNLLGVLLAGLAMWMIGYIWFGMVFSELWKSENGYTKEMLEGQSPLWTFVGGPILAFVLAFGLGWHMKQKNITKTKTAILMGLWMALLIGVPLMAYALVYSVAHSVPLFLINAGYTVVTFVAATAVLSFFD